MPDLCRPRKAAARQQVTDSHNDSHGKGRIKGGEIVHRPHLSGENLARQPIFAVGPGRQHRSAI